MTVYDADFEPIHQGTATDHYLTELELYGYRPSFDDPDPRPIPEDVQVQGAVLEIMDALIGTLDDTALEPDLEDLLWGAVNLFHRAADRLGRSLDDNEVAQRRCQDVQDGSEVRSVELERLIVTGMGLIARRDALEAMRDHAADLYQSYMRTPWRPKYGSQVNHRAQTSAMVDSRDFIAAKRKASTEVLVPPGPKVVFTGGLDCQDHGLIWAKLDKARAQHPDMVLVHGGSPRGAELIAAKWADNRKVAQIAFKPDWTRHGKAAPFKRNDQMLDTLPIGVIVVAGGTGIQENLADKARTKGIRVARIGEGECPKPVRLAQFSRVLREAGERIRLTFSPYGTTLHRFLIGKRNVIGTVFQECVDKKNRLPPVFLGFEAIMVSPAIRHNQLVNSEALWPRYLEVDARAIWHCGTDGLSNKIVQVVQGLGSDAKCRKGPDFFCSRSGRQEFDQGGAPCLAPAPCGHIGQRRHRLE